MTGRPRGRESGRARASAPSRRASRLERVYRIPTSQGRPPARPPPARRSAVAREARAEARPARSEARRAERSSGPRRGEREALAPWPAPWARAPRPAPSRHVRSGAGERGRGVREELRVSLGRAAL